MINKALETTINQDHGILYTKFQENGKV